MARMSDAQWAWLERLEREGAGHRPGRTGYTTMQKGWTEWEWSTPEGEMKGTADVAPTFGSEPGAWSRARDAGWETTGRERLTELGRAAMALERRARWRT